MLLLSLLFDVFGIEISLKELESITLELLEDPLLLESLLRENDTDLLKSMLMSLIDIPDRSNHKPFNPFTL